MNNKKSYFFISLILLLLLGISIIFLFDSYFFNRNNIFYRATWFISYSFLFIKILFVPSSYIYNYNGINLKPNYRINVIVPSYNEDDILLKRTIDSILNQDYPINKIFVVDDGSKLPIKTFDHPKITWLKKNNAGKRYAQKYALDSMNKDDVDFILTIDSDSIIEKQATQKMLNEFEKDKSLQAITGLVLTDNFRTNILTRIIDLNIAISCIISRPIRSFYGALETTSGALSMYRKDILFNNIDEYVSIGSYSDDRQLCYYSALNGNVKALTNLTVESNMPSNLTGVLKQRIRWSKGSWIFFPKQMRNLPIKKLVFPIISMFQTILILVFFTFIIRSFILKNYWSIFIYFLIRYISRFSQAVLYIGNEKRMSSLEKIFTLLVITPLEVLFTMFLISPIKYISLFYLKADEWLTR